VCDSLFYVLQGKTEVSKGDKIFTLSPNTFIGEVGYFLRSAASATTIIEKGSVYVSWRTPDLRELEVESPGVRSKIYELMNKDMASKVASSQG
jgi:CRP-like cAMP-binding protein